MIPTAEEFFEEWCNKKRYTSIDEADDIHECMIEFTKMHCEAKLKAILKVTHKGSIPRIVKEKDIINAYPPNLIK